MLSKFCPSCGTPASGGKFCMNCGTSLELPDPQTVPAEAVQQTGFLKRRRPLRLTHCRVGRRRSLRRRVTMRPFSRLRSLYPPQTAFTPSRCKVPNSPQPPVQNAYTPAGVSGIRLPPMQGGYSPMQSEPWQKAKRSGSSAGKTIGIIAGSIVLLAILIVGGLYVVGKIAGK